MKKKILIVVGTRPEAIKMAPVYRALQAEDSVNVFTLNSGQHSELITQVFDVFNWKPDYTLDLQRTSPHLADLYALLLTKLSAALNEIRPDIVLVHGDTATTVAAAFAAFLNQIPVGHVEAGLRSFNRMEPWPEEINRKLISALANLYFVPTQAARQNLLHEGVAAQTIHVTGNTAVDAVLAIAASIDTTPKQAAQLDKQFDYLDSARKLVLVTGHRRENSGENIRNVFSALQYLALNTACQIVFPSHPNHDTQDLLRCSLEQTPHVHIIPPLEYTEFVYLMRRCDLIISDSGGVQEEAPTFKKKVLVTRNVTERPEGIESGFLEIVGCNKNLLIERAQSLLFSEKGSAIEFPNPYGDGHAAKRIREIIIKNLVHFSVPSKNNGEKPIDSTCKKRGYGITTS